MPHTATRLSMEVRGLGVKMAHNPCLCFSHKANWATNMKSAQLRATGSEANLFTSQDRTPMFNFITQSCLRFSSFHRQFQCELGNVACESTPPFFQAQGVGGRKNEPLY